tara:strand:- start:37 stop:552 length:516 start_codon:yes stop_codon:yes gene_type:complete
MDKLLYVPNPFLRQKAKKIEIVGEEELKIANKMKEIMLRAPGVGLAANQIGILKQIVTIYFIDKESKRETNYTLFNPEIIEYSKDKVLMEEGCLSIPEQFAEIERPNKIVLRYLNNKNKFITKEAEGVESRILQHEIDHLYGKLFIDYLSNLKKNIIIRKVKKYLKNKNND